MAALLHLSGPLLNAWEVLLLFLIPIGGGIPAGVLLAKARGIEWPLMMLLYFISDVILACLFEPLMKLVIAIGRHVQALQKTIETFKKLVKKSTAHYGNKSGPLALILISFGVDPMTGRAAAVAAGHGFLSGWLIAITGDMISFVVLMVSILLLRSIFGDGTQATIIILVVMIIAPSLLRRMRERRKVV